MKIIGGFSRSLDGVMGWMAHWADALGRGHRGGSMHLLAKQGQEPGFQCLSPAQGGPGAVWSALCPQHRGRGPGTRWVLGKSCWRRSESISGVPAPDFPKLLMSANSHFMQLPFKYLYLSRDACLWKIHSLYVHCFQQPCNHEMNS